MNKYLSLIPLVIIIIASFILYKNSLINPSYEGLQAVPCIDTTHSIVQNYSVNIKIKINNKNYPLDSKIGHDYGQCLHEIYTNDNSGKVFIKTNDTNSYTLGQFFDVWHKTFNNNQVFDLRTDSNHHILILVNGKPYSGNEVRDIPLFPPNSTIEVIYK